MHRLLHLFSTGAALKPSSSTLLACRALLSLVVTACAAAALPAQAQETPIKFQLDWRFEGPAALFLVPAAKGYFLSLIHI